MFFRRNTANVNENERKHQERNAWCTRTCSYNLGYTWWCTEIQWSGGGNVKLGFSNLTVCTSKNVCHQYFDEDFQTCCQRNEILHHCANVQATIDSIIFIYFDNEISTTKEESIQNTTYHSSSTMDVIIPAHNLKILSSSISTLSKIGKILYIEFDPLDGLTIRALNDAKSSFVYFHFEVGFFERCSSSSNDFALNGASNSNGNANGSRRTRGRQRRSGNGRRSNRSNAAGEVGTTSPQRYSRRRDRFRRRSRSRRKRSRSHDNESDNDSNGNNDENDSVVEEGDEKYLCKVPIKTIASILRPRKGVTSLRIHSSQSPPTVTNRSQEDEDDNYDDEEIGSHMQLSFEYNIQSDGIMRILHKVGVSNAEGIVALAPKHHCSEIVTLPKLLLTMFDQVKSTTEVALTVNDVTKKVVASSFHYGHQDGDDNEGNTNIMLNATNAAILKTETSIDCHEFEDFHFMDSNDAQQCMEEEEEGERDGEATSSSFPPPPEGVAEQVTLVFSIKEAKAMLQFCAASQASYVDDEDARVIVSFYWGGRPIIFETEGEAFRGELILATVDHSLLNGMNAARYTTSGSRTPSRRQR